MEEIKKTSSELGIYQGLSFWQNEWSLADWIS